VGAGREAKRRRWRIQRGGAPAAVEKIELASSAKIFSGTARRVGRTAIYKGGCGLQPALGGRRKTLSTDIMVCLQVFCKGRSS